MLELTQSFMIPLVRLQNSLKWPLENTPHVGQIQIADSDLPLPPLRMCFNRSLQAPPPPPPLSVLHSVRRLFFHLYQKSD